MPFGVPLHRPGHTEPNQLNEEVNKWVLVMLETIPLRGVEAPPGVVDARGWKGHWDHIHSYLNPIRAAAVT